MHRSAILGLVCHLWRDQTGSKEICRLQAPVAACGRSHAVKLFIAEIAYTKLVAVSRLDLKTSCPESCCRCAYVPPRPFAHLWALPHERKFASFQKKSEINRKKIKINELPSVLCHTNLMQTTNIHLISSPNEQAFFPSILGINTNSMCECV